MDQLFALAEKMDARVLLSGDRRQHGSVERGSALRLLEEEAGLVPAEVKEIKRQSGDYKEAVKALSEGRVAEGFKRLDDLNWVREIPDEERDRQLAADYVQAVREGKTALVVSPDARGRTPDHHGDPPTTCDKPASLATTNETFAVSGKRQPDRGRTRRRHQLRARRRVAVPSERQGIHARRSA